MLKDTNGQIVTNSKKIEERWKDYTEILYCNARQAGRKMTRSKVDGLSYSSNRYTDGRPEGPGWGQIIMEKVCMWSLRVNTDWRTINGFLYAINLLPFVGLVKTCSEASQYRPSE